MRAFRSIAGAIVLGAAVIAAGFTATAQTADPVQLGPRPFFLVENMDPGALQDALRQCEGGPFARTNFSIGHRGAPLQFPSTRSRATRPRRGWAPAFSNAT